MSSTYLSRLCGTPALCGQGSQSSSSSSASHCPLVKRTKVLDTRPETLFNIVKGCLPYKKHFISDDYEKSATTFKGSYPKLYSYILENGPDVRQKIAEYVRNPNSPLPQKIKETLYWLPAIAGKNIPLQPEIVSGILRKYIMNSYIPEEIAEELTEDRRFVFALTEIPFKDLEANALVFAKDDSEVVREFLLTSLRHLYLHALGSTESVTLLWTFEMNQENELTRLLEISQPQFFHCASWQLVEEFFRNEVSQPLVDDLQALRKTAQKLRCWMADLQELERALFLNKEHMLFLAKNSFYPDQITPTFPFCLEHFPILFDQLDLCRRQFGAAGVLKAIRQRFQECQNLLAHNQSKEIKTDLSSFLSTYDIAIYQAGLQLLSELYFKKFKEWKTEEELYSFSNDHFGLDPIEWMHQLIEALSPDDFVLMKEGLQNVQFNQQLENHHQEDLLVKMRADFLAKHLKDKLQLPENLEDLKTRFEFHLGEPL